MKLKMYLAQIKQGQYEASIPWIAQLAQPIRGQSPAQLKEELMFRALELLASGRSVSDVSYKLGYEGPSAFVATFRKSFGVTPGRYLNNLAGDVGKRPSPFRSPSASGSPGRRSGGRG